MVEVLGHALAEIQDKQRGNYKRALASGSELRTTLAELTVLLDYERRRSSRTQRPAPPSRRALN
jgi:hypothetical protein